MRAATPELLWSTRNGEGWAASPLTGTYEYDHCVLCALMFEIPCGRVLPFGWPNQSICRSCHLAQVKEAEVAEATRLRAEVSETLARKHREAENLRLEVEAFSETKKNPYAKHGITPEDYLALVEASGGVCAVCKRTCSPVSFFRAAGVDPTGLVFCVDHDKRLEVLPTSERWKCVRGLLCNPCNSALGLLREDPETIDGLLNYAKFFHSGGKNKTLLARYGK